MNKDNKKIYILLVIFSMIFTFFGGSLAYWQWTTNESEKTSIALTIDENFRCDADGGGNISNEEKTLIPTDCTNPDYAIQRTVTVSPTIYSDSMGVSLNLWLNVNSIDTGLKNTTNFKYALTNNSNSCTKGVISSGSFNGATVGRKFNILTDSIYTESTTDTYYLYIWLDSSETSTSTMNQKFNLSLGGECNEGYNLYEEQVELKANLINGETFNSLLKELNEDMTEFKKSPTEPNLEEIDYIMLSANNSDFPVYAWNDNNIIYWWSEAEKLSLNSNSNSMFYGFESLTNVEFSTLDSSEVTSMDFMFQHCNSLTTIDLRLDTSKVTSMDAMFANCTRLESIDFSHIDTSKVKNFHGLVAGCTELRSINLNGFNVESAISFESMFSTLPNLTEIDLSSFKTPNLENVYFMFLRCTNLTTVYADEEITIDKITGTGAFFLANKIVGGAGTVYDANNSKNTAYFRIDDPDNGKPGYLTLKDARYIRYDGNGADGGETMTSHYLTTTVPGNLKTNTYTNTGLTFIGWNTEPDGSGENYTNGQLMDSLVASKIPLTLYAQWQ